MFGRISQKHLEAVPGLLEQADERLWNAEVHIRNRNCKNAIWNLMLAARSLGRAYESYESARLDAYQHKEFQATLSRLDRLTKEIADHCRMDI